MIVTPEQRGYLWGEIYPSIAEGIDILLNANGHQLALLTSEEVHALAKASMGIKSTEALPHEAACDYLTTLQALAAECLIFIASPEEWKRGTDSSERARHYAYVLDIDSRTLDCHSRTIAA